METVTEMTPKQRIENWAAGHGVTMQTVFVPWSKSRNKDEKSPSLNWVVTLAMPHGTLTTDYMAGSGHCPAYKAPVAHYGHRTSVMRDEAIRQECKTGRANDIPQKPLLPDLADVLYSLANDADVLNYSGFEDWASSLGYDADSRAAETTYRACLDIALKFRNGVGEDAMRKLQETCQDY